MFEFQPSSKIKAAIQIHFRNETKGKIHLPSSCYRKLAGALWTLDKIFLQ